MNTINNFHLLKTSILTLVVWLTITISAFSQDYLFDLETISVEDGLPHRNTFVIIQDKEGFMWVSMLGVISRYDGYRFKTYSSSELKMPESGACKYMAVDKANRIWYAGGDVYKKKFYSGVIDTRHDSVYTMEAISEGRFTSEDVTHVSNIDANTVILTTRAGVVYAYDGDFNEIYRNSEAFTWHFECKAMPDGSYWISNNTELIHVKYGKRLKTITKSPQVVRILKNRAGLVLETAYDTLSNYWTLHKDTLVPYTTKMYLPKGDVMPLQIHDHYTAYAVEDTLFIKDTLGKILSRFTISEAMKAGPIVGWQNGYTNRQNNLWITTGNGLLKITSRKNSFTILKPGNSIRGIYCEGKQLWIGSHGKNSVIDSATGIEKEFWQHQYAAISSFCTDDQGKLWMASGGALIKYNKAADTYIPYYFNSHFLSLSLIFQNNITRNYWVGSANGIFKFDINDTILKPGSQQYIAIDKDEFLKPLPLPIPPEDVHVRQFYQNSDGIWIVTNKGLFLMDGEKETIIKHYTVADGLITNNLNHLYEDSNGIFWLGTKGEGLVRWDVKNNNFRQFTRNEGLSNNTIYAIYEDDYQTLWLPSDHGLMAFDKATKTTRVYLPQNGIAHEEFNTHAHFKDKDGTLYFGGLNGVTKFHPKDFQQQYTNASPLYITAVRVLQQDAETFTDVFSTYKNTQKISLAPGDRILEVDLTLLDYEKSDNNQYAYKLSGKQEQWIYTTDNKISIISPPYGKYNLEVKARGASGQWSDKLLTIPLYVRTPFYLQWWFFVAVAFAIVISVFIVIRWRIQKLNKDRSRLEEEVKKRTYQIEQDKQVIEAQAEELKVLDKAKSRFFANITHEFRTPLTLVTGPLKQMISKPPSPDNIGRKLSGILRNAEGLLGLINQLLDISKLEGHKMQVERSYGDMMSYTTELTAQFQPMARKKNIRLEVKTIPNHWETNFDADKWQKIINNLLSNTLKFTPEGGNVSVQLEQLWQNGQEAIQLLVKDSGIGIAEEKLNHIFDRFYQADASSTRAQGGTGIGLALVKELVKLQEGAITVESTPGKGTAFSVILPVLPADTDETAVTSIPQFETFPSAEETETPDSPAILQNTGNKKLQLLIIEDNAEMRIYIRSCIDETAYQVTEAADGAEGIVKALEIVPDLIISDVMMPEKDGFQVTQEIRNHIATSHIPLILLTAKASLESRLKGLERGADAYLTKPFSPQELVLRIQKLIKLRQLLQQRYQGQESPEDSVTFKQEDGFVSKLKDYITSHLTETNLNAKVISRHFALSERQLYRKLHALINKPIGDHIRSIRMETALRLLKERQLNITEVAYETGFSSLSSFSRAFKKVYGKAPSEWP